MPCLLEFTQFINEKPDKFVMTQLKKYSSIFILSVFILMNSAFSAENNPFCEKNGAPNFPCLKIDNNSLSQNLIGSLENFVNVLWIENEVRNTCEVYRQKKNLVANVFRKVKHNRLPDKAADEEASNEIKGTISDFQVLFQLMKHIHFLKSHLEACYSGWCSPTTRLEKEDQLSALQRAKTLMLIKRPLLASEPFEIFLRDQIKGVISDDLMPRDTYIEDIILKASQEVAQNLVEKTDYCDSFITTTFDESTSNPKSRRTSLSEFTFQSLEKHPKIVDDLLSKYELFPPSAEKFEFLCKISTKRQSQKRTEKIIQTSLDIALFAAPFALGPWGRAGLLGVESALGAKLLKWGLSAKDIERGAWATRSITNISINALQYNELRELEQKCKNIEENYLLNPNESKLKQVNECREEYRDNVLFNSMGLIFSFAPNISPPILKFYKERFSAQLTKKEMPAILIGNDLRTKPLASTEWAREFKTSDQGVFTYMDLSKRRQVTDPDLMRAPDDYWHFVGDVYSERLPLSPEQIKSFIKTSEEFSLRTKLIVNSTTDLKKAETFNGGIGIVHSATPLDLLPVEKALGIKIPRTPNEKVAEVVRLTVSKDADAAQLSKALVHQGAAVVLQDPSITKIVIYTSKIHSRLYRNMGANVSNIKDVGNSDVVITLTRADVESMYLKTK